MNASTLPEIDYYPRDLALGLLGISEPTLSRDIKTLRKKLPRAEFDYRKGEGGFTVQSFKVLAKFRQLRRQGMSRLRAVETIRINGVD